MSENEFLPKDYKVPGASGGYMRFDQGENIFRIMSKPIMGMEYWTTDEEGNRKPVRLRPNETFSPDDLETDEEGNLIFPKHFWAMIVWNYKEKRLQILEITQKTIQKALRVLSRNNKWGNPMGTDGYDIVVERSGKGLETEYLVNSNPKEKLDEEIVAKYNNCNIDLEKLYDGEDPFAGKVNKETVDPDEIPF